MSTSCFVNLDNEEIVETEIISNGENKPLTIDFQFKKSFVTIFINIKQAKDLTKKLNEIFKIGDLFHQVYLAGRNGEDFILKQENFKDGEIY